MSDEYWTDRQIKHRYEFFLDWDNLRAIDHDNSPAVVLGKRHTLVEAATTGQIQSTKRRGDEHRKPSKRDLQVLSTHDCSMPISSDWRFLASDVRKIFGPVAGDGLPFLITQAKRLFESIRETAGDEMARELWSKIGKPPRGRPAGSRGRSTDKSYADVDRELYDQIDEMNASAGIDFVCFGQPDELHGLIREVAESAPIPKCGHSVDAIRKRLQRGAHAHYVARGVTLLGASLDRADEDKKARD